MKQTREEPLRMCVACREMKDKDSLHKIIKSKEGEFILNPTGRAQGRGAYICKNESCLNMVLKKKLLNKSFKREVPMEIYDTIAELIK
ncbi:MAG: YlxR family protein [Bacillota bacterium]